LIKLAFISQGRIYRGRALLTNLLKRSIYSNRAVKCILSQNIPIRKGFSDSQRLNALLSSVYRDIKLPSLVTE